MCKYFENALLLPHSPTPAGRNFYLYTLFAVLGVTIENSPRGYPPLWEEYVHTFGSCVIPHLHRPRVHFVTLKGPRIPRRGIPGN